MTTQLVRWKVTSDKSTAHFCQIACFVVAGFVLLLGFRRLAEFEFTEAQLFFASVGTLLLTGLFIVLGFLCRIWRHAA